MRKLFFIALIYVLLLATTAQAKLGWFKKSSDKSKTEVTQAAPAVQETQAQQTAAAPAVVQEPAAKKVTENVSTVPQPLNAGQLVIADFDTGDKPNNLGGDFGAWNKDPEDATQSCNMSFETDDALKDPAGYALKLDYDVDSPNPAYNGVWMKLDGQNASNFNTLSFYVRGEGLNNFTKRIKLEIKDSAKNSSPYIVSGITESWQKIEVPFDRFKKIKDWSSLSEFVVVFDDMNSDPKQGTILLDQITFEKK